MSMVAPDSSLELLDLRVHPDEALLRRLYEELYLTTFVDPAEQETFEQYRSRLFDPQLPPPQPVTHCFVAGTDLVQVASARLAGFAIFESYRTSGCGLLTYIVTVPALRGQGLGRRLFAAAQGALRSDLDAWDGESHVPTAIFAEMHDPALVAAGHDVIDPATRLQIMRRLGAVQVPVDYVQPELYPGGERSRQLVLATFPPEGAEPVSSLPAAVVKSFLREFYRALGVVSPETDADYLAMLADLDRAEREPPQDSPTPLPRVRVTA